MRYVIKFTKDSEIKFVSHLDLMRTIQRIVRRADLPAEYSKGFNPHMSLSIAQPLSVGIYSEGEYMDVVLTEEVCEDSIVVRLNEKSPRGIRFLKAVKVPEEEGKKIPQTMAVIEAAAYEVKIKYEDTARLDAEIRELLEKKDWVTLKKSKSGEKSVNIRSMILDLDYIIVDDSLLLTTIVSCGSKENLSPELLGSYIKANTSSIKPDSFVDIKRNELFTRSGDCIIPIGDYIKEYK